MSWDSRLFFYLKYFFKYEKKITNEKNLENMQNRMNELVNTIQM